MFVFVSISVERDKYTCKRQVLKRQVFRITLFMKRKHADGARSASADVDAANERGRAAGVSAVAAAKQRGATVINHGAGTMPVDAPAPNGGVRYNLLIDEANAPPPHWVEAPLHCGLGDPPRDGESPRGLPGLPRQVGG